MEPVGTTPLLPPQQRHDDDHHHHHSESPSRRIQPRGAARFLRRTRLRDQSLRVRESAAEQLEERRTEWAYSKPVVVLDLFWNVLFIAVSISFLIWSRDELPKLPLRLWLLGYAAQCVLHVGCVSAEYRRRRGSERGSDVIVNETENENPSSNSNSNSESESEENDSNHENQNESHGDSERTSVAKHLESANTMFSFIWWIIGFYWVMDGGETLAQDSPQLYWLCITFLALDVFFVVICVAAACVIGVAVCCCLPCIIAILYAVTDQEGAREEDLERLPKYKFRRHADFNKIDGEIQVSFGGIMTQCGTDIPVERSLLPEDAECCICLTPYEDGAELRELPCRHHFHCACIDKWLYMNAVCPLCKFNILKNGNQDGCGAV